MRILLQTTIVSGPDDWTIDRFGLLAAHLASVTDASGARLFEVTARDRGPLGAPDPVISKLDRASFDAVWLIAVDAGDGLNAADCGGIDRFRRAGGGLLVTRDHADVGRSICSLADIGAAHFFHTRNLDPDASRRCTDDIATTSITWPNYHSGANGDFQLIETVGDLHPVLLDPAGPDGRITMLPAHPHEGAVGAPDGDPAARVIATGRSRISGVRFNTAVAFAPSASAGPAIAQSTFHHFADYNWDPTKGCPTFVTESPGDGIARSFEAQRQIRRYATSLAIWLTGQSPLTG
jgi:hypothetical protein